MGFKAQDIFTFYCTTQNTSTKIKHLLKSFVVFIAHLQTILIGPYLLDLNKD